MSGLICELCWRSSVVFPSGSILADPESAMLFARWCDHLEIVNIFVVVIIGLVDRILAIDVRLQQSCFTPYVIRLF